MSYLINQFNCELPTEGVRSNYDLSKIKKPVSMHTLRHSFATHLLELGTDHRFIQELLEHKSVKTSEIYTHISSKTVGKIQSPIDFY